MDLLQKWGIKRGAFEEEFATSEIKQKINPIAMRFTQQERKLTQNRVYNI